MATEPADPPRPPGRRGGLRARLLWFAGLWAGSVLAAAAAALLLRALLGAAYSH